MSRLPLRVSALTLAPAMVLVLGLIAQDDVIKVEVNLVNVLCTVRGKNNALIGNLEKSDFHLLEDAKEQEIKYFTRETDLPLTIGLLELTGRARAMQEMTFQVFEAFAAATVLYLITNLIVVLGMRLLERKVRVPGLIAAGGAPLAGH